jgi:hypothetical protein
MVVKIIAAIGISFQVDAYLHYKRIQETVFLLHIENLVDETL